MLSRVSREFWIFLFVVALLTPFEDLNEPITRNPSTVGRGERNRQRSAHGRATTRLEGTCGERSRHCVTGFDLLSTYSSRH